MTTNNKQDLDDALDFDIFEGDFGTPCDTELSNKIVTSRGEYKCHICAGEILKGENHRSTTWKFDGELMSYLIWKEHCMRNRKYQATKMLRRLQDITAKYLLFRSLGGSNALFLWRS